MASELTRNQKRLLKAFKDAPPVKWNGMVRAIKNTKDQIAIRNELQAEAEGLVRRAAYMDELLMSDGHARAVKKQNTVGRALRKAFGFSYPASADFTFSMIPLEGN